MLVAFVGALLNLQLETAIAVLFVFSLFVFMVALTLFVQEAMVALGEFNRMADSKQGVAPGSAGEVGPLWVRLPCCPRGKCSLQPVVAPEQLAILRDEGRRAEEASRFRLLADPSQARLVGLGLGLREHGGGLEPKPCQDVAEDGGIGNIAARRRIPR